LIVSNSSANTVVVSSLPPYRIFYVHPTPPLLLRCHIAAHSSLSADVSSNFVGSRSILEISHRILARLACEVDPVDDKLAPLSRRRIGLSHIMPSPIARRLSAIASNEEGAPFSLIAHVIQSPGAGTYILPAGVLSGRCLRPRTSPQSPDRWGCTFGPPRCLTP
jgi:hypothetical protein